MSNLRYFARRGRCAALIAASILAMALLGSAHAQETPEATPEATTPAGQNGETTVRLEIDQPEEPPGAGDVFDVRVLIDDVDHLSSFDVTIEFDPDEVRPVRRSEEEAGTPAPTPNESLGQTEFVEAAQLGAVLEETDRGDGLFCPDPFSREGSVVVSCNTLGLPVCLGGPAGASGSGVLAVVPFESRGGGLTEFEISSSTLVLDDVTEPCGPDSSPIPIDHQRQGASIELAPKEDSNTLLIIIIVVIVAVAVVVAAGGGYWWYRQRSARPAEN